MKRNLYIHPETESVTLMLSSLIAATPGAGMMGDGDAPQKPSRRCTPANL